MLTTFVTALAAVAAFAGTATAANSLEPCALVAAQASAPNPRPYRVDAKTALACLKSVPLDTKRNPDLLKALRATVKFQSTLAYLKNPPPGALYPAVDLLGGIDDVASKLKSGYFQNEFDFQYELYGLSKSAHDFHFNLYVDITQIFRWRRSESLISVSKDSLSLPEIYALTDLAALNGSRSYTPAPVSKINGVDVETWINNYAGLDPLGHDPDTNYNAVLYNGPLANMGTSSRSIGSFAATYRPQPFDTILTFTNGTDRKIDTYVTTGSDFTGVRDGPSFFKTFCKGAGPIAPSNATSTHKANIKAIEADTADRVVKIATKSTSTRKTVAPTSTLVPFTPVSTQTAVPVNFTVYPKPLVINSDYSAAGYLPDDRKDLAVLVLPTFEPANAQSFQNAVRSLLATAQQQNRTKLIVDIRGNTGGFIYVGYDTFRQLFPTIMPFGTAVMRSFPLYQDIVSIYSDYYKSTPALAESGQGSPFNDLNFLDVNGKQFNSTQSFLGPFPSYGDNFTALERANLNKTSSTAPVDVYGFGHNTDPMPQVFKAENMVMLSDGFCGSTCAIFSEFMKSQGNVKSIVVGGRKQQGPMQSVGGSKGAQVITISSVQGAISFAKEYASSAANITLSSNLMDLVPGLLNLVARTNKGAGIRYVYEAADCRFFYTPAMLTKQSLVWNVAADIAWNGAQCVPGSAGQPSSLSGDLLSHMNDYAPAGANYTFSATDSPYPSGIANPASASGPKGTPVRAPSAGSTFLARSTYVMSASSSTSTSWSATTTAASTTSSASAAATTSTTPSNGATGLQVAGTGLTALVAVMMALF
ncbi:hypothetical protein AMS68_005351 [Peltaster fructicola]|uniref:Uncharacterized protein n=1 Tax=Peltaster fructicola TaxID=286661 RepID=A0A6H0XYK7_9PEZI|nr:hypothetical protein AMS68_005351 [Peltaster fructicola]